MNRWIILIIFFTIFGSCDNSRKPVSSFMRSVSGVHQANITNQFVDQKIVIGVEFYDQDGTLTQKLNDVAQISGENKCKAYWHDTQDIFIMKMPEREIRYIFREGKFERE